MLRNTPLSFRVGGLILLLATPVLRAGDPATAAAWQRLHAKAQATIATAAQAAVTLPPAAADVTDLSFRDFFAPAGDAGLEFSARIRELAGKRVRLVGFMVREPRRQHGVFVLAPFPTTVEAGGACFTDDVPAAAVHVHLPASRQEEPVPYTPGRVVFTGILELGQHHEADGRNSAIRLRLDEPVGVGSAVANYPSP